MRLRNLIYTGAPQIVSYRYFGAKERHTLMYLLHWRLSYRDIGRRLGRHHTTISREVINGRLIACYRDGLAQNVRWFDARNRGTLAGGRIKNACIMPSIGYRRIGHRKQMAGRLKLDHPRSACLRISPEGIYRWIYENAAQVDSLYQHLLRRHKKRLRQQQYGTGRGLTPDCVSIHDRPLSIGNRHRFGHWRGDSVEGAKGSGGIATHVERKSRVLVAAKLSDKSADTFYLVTTTALRSYLRNGVKP
ncbi:IS30 family transposase [Candidatus Vondammii sp. HM_W22]|uniref:IS30 family transposase n=1 Tax=Candidatus Vondammii sp. HM_W22 TaxID=2687299 RepID=UPI002E7B608F|nr:IS30 family transposase [Candidatus Vondammii sp. HM_W22]